MEKHKVRRQKMSKSNAFAQDLNRSSTRTDRRAVY